MYDFGLSSEQFFRMTPRQFALLCDRQREEMAHRELVAAWTTCAVKNHSMCPPEEPASPLDFMPNHREQAAAGNSSTPELSEEALERQSNWNISVAEAAQRAREEYFHGG